MARRQHDSAEADDSDASFSTSIDDVSDVSDVDMDEVQDGPDPDLVALDDVDDSFDDGDIDVEDQLQLFEGNTHPPEYYRQAIVDFNESDFDGEDYSPGTTRLLDGVEEQWNW